MGRKKTLETQQQNPDLLQPITPKAPIVRVNNGHVDLLTASAIGYEPKSDMGMVTVAELDAAGNELAGSEFQVNERTYNKTYRDNPRFTLKKSLK